ncbi:hypothetical protein Tco_1262854 [Tanacetum coccineum]
MEEYIELEAKKSRRHGRAFNWETATYGKVSYFDDFDYLKDFENELPAIVYDGALMSGPEISSKPMVSPLNDDRIDFRISFDESDDEDYIVMYDKDSFSYKLIFVNDFKMDSENDIDEVDLPHNDVVIVQLGNDINYNINTQSYELEEDFEKNHDIHREPPDMGEYLIIIKVVIQMHFHEGMPLIFIIKNLYVLFGISFDPKRFYKDGGYAIELRRPRYEVEGYTEEIVHDFEGRLDTIFGGQVNRVHILDFKGLTEEMRETLTGRLRIEYTGTKGQVLMSDTELGLDVADTLCFQLGGARRGMTWRQFILALGLHTKEMVGDGLIRLTVIARELLVIDMDELVRLRFYDRIGDTCAWVAPGPKRQPVAAAEAPKGVEGSPVSSDEGKESLGERRKVLDAMSRDFSRFTTWMVGRLSQLLDASGMSYMSYGDYQIPYQRRTRRRTDGASTLAPQQPNP